MLRTRKRKTSLRHGKTQQNADTVQTVFELKYGENGDFEKNLVNSTKHD